MSVAVLSATNRFMTTDEISSLCRRMERNASWLIRGKTVRLWVRQTMTTKRNRYQFDQIMTECEIGHYLRSGDGTRINPNPVESLPIGEVGCHIETKSGLDCRH